MSAGPFLTCWGLFRALEAACEGTRLPSPTVDGLYEAALTEIGGEGLDAGWHLVAARLPVLSAYCGTGMRPRTVVPRPA